MKTVATFLTTLCMSLGAFAQVQQAPDYKPMVCEMTDFVITLDGIEGDT